MTFAAESERYIAVEVDALFMLFFWLVILSTLAHSVLLSGCHASVAAVCVLSMHAGDVAV